MESSYGLELSHLQSILVYLAQEGIHILAEAEALIYKRARGYLEPQRPCQYPEPQNHRNNAGVQNTRGYVVGQNLGGDTLLELRTRTTGHSGQKIRKEIGTPIQ